jgi:hypothetical protein
MTIGHIVTIGYIVMPAEAGICPLRRRHRLRPPPE